MTHSFPCVPLGFWAIAPTRHKSQLFNKGLSDEQSVEGIPVIVGQRISSQSVVQMYGQNLKAIGSHLLGDEVLKVVTGNAKTAETSLDRDLPAARGTEVGNCRPEAWRL